MISTTKSAHQSEYREDREEEKIEEHENIAKNHRHDSLSMKKRVKEKGKKDWVLVLRCNVNVIRLDDASQR